MVGLCLYRCVQYLPLRSPCGMKAAVVLAVLEVTPVREQQHSNEPLSFLGRLAGMLSHELRNPLNAIFLHLDILDEEVRQLSPGDRTQVDLSLGTVKAEVTRLHDLMQDYLALVRLSDLQHEPEDVRMLLEAVAREVRDRLAARGIVLHLEGLEGLGEVSMHKSTLQRAFLNLVQLAVAAMPQGGNLTLRGWKTPAHVHLGVHHTGHTPQPHDAPQDFSASLATALEEETLAFHVAQTIVTAHGGVLEVCHTSGQSMGFAVTLPSI
jgi:signal transduction histidine kinase